MPYQTWIVDALKREGVRVETVAGWQTRGNPSFNPRGTVCHWTAGPRGTRGRPSLNVVVNGRPGLPGPLCQVYLDRNGVAVVVAAGRANHAGSGGYRGMVGNSSVFGIEAECGGDGDWTAAQRREYPKVVAALQRGMGRDASTVCGHSEWTSRKIDIRDWPMSRMRTDVAAILAGGRPSTPSATSPKKGFLMALSDKQQTEIYDAIMDLRPGRSGKYHDGQGFSILRDARNFAQEARNAAQSARDHASTASHSVTPGETGKKTAGVLYELLLRTFNRVGNINIPDTAEVDVEALAETLAPLLEKRDVDELAKAILRKQGEALTDATKGA